MRRILLYLTFLLSAAFMACSDDDTFSANPNNLLSFTTDTVKLDTIFSGVGSSTYTFWVHNKGNDGIRLRSVRLRQGNQTGYRVNVDGLYLDNALGSVVSGIEVRRGDSLRVFVELTTPEQDRDEARLVQDDLVFSLESGVEQKVCLSCYTWDAIKLTDLDVASDTVIESSRPVVVYGNGITVRSGATLTLRNTTLYFHDKAGIDVYGSLTTDGCLLRGDRLDHMFDYLPYDRVSGQWRGLHFYDTSAENSLVGTEIRNACDALVMDSTQLDTTQVRLTMTRCIVHNAKGNGVVVVGSKSRFTECQFTNTLGHCLSIIGGVSDIDHCTIAQFYPFVGDNGTALHFANYMDDNDVPLLRLHCGESIVTGYSSDVVTGDVRDTTSANFNYAFRHTLLRTPRVVTADSVRFDACLWETSKDSVQGKHHFVLIDEENLKYDFHLDSLSTAKGLGCYPVKDIP